MAGKKKQAMDASNRVFSQLDLLAKIISEQYNVKVVSKGTECSWDGDTITLPSLPDDASPELVEALQGFLDKTLSNVIFTDAEAISRSKIHEELSTWVDIVEEARAEETYFEMLPGAKSNIRNKTDFVFDKIKNKKWDTELSESAKRMYVAKLYTKDREDLIDELPDGDKMLDYWIDIQAALDLASEQPSSLHSLSLAIWIMDTLRPDWRDELPEDGLDSLGDPSELEEALNVISQTIAKGSGDDEEEREEVEGDPMQASVDPDSYRDFEGVEEEEYDAFGNKRSYSKDNYLPPKKKELEALEETSALQEASYEYIRGKDDPDLYIPYDTSDDKFSLVQHDSNDLVWFNEQKREVKRMAGVLSRRLKRKLVVASYTRNEYEKASGRINTKRIARFLMTGNERVFKRKSKGKDLKARAVLVIDQSGSMSGSRIHNARLASILFGEFCNSLGIPFEIIGFTTLSRGNKYDTASTADQNTYTRWDPLQLFHYKGYNEKWNKVGGRIHHMTAHNHNCDGESIKICAQRLMHAAQPDERKIMFVFSDGQPAQTIWKYNDLHARYLKQVMKDIQTAGIEAIGIGIQTDVVKHFYPNWVKIDDPRDLALTQMTKLEEVFAGGTKR